MRFYMGFDVGDAESVVSMGLSDKASVQPATMPGKNAAGQAIPTLFGYDSSGDVVLANSVASDYEDLKNVEMNFKRRPSDLLHADEVRTAQLLQMDRQTLMSQAEFQSGSLKLYSQQLVQFVNIILEDSDFSRRAKEFAAGCDECQICVGHPSNWNALDRHIYRRILEGSVLGRETYLEMPLSFSLELESRAAFLYIKSTYIVHLKPGEYVGLMDVGSSTIDISVLTADSRNVLYDSGSNFLGARSIDYLILQYYREQIHASDESDGALLDSILENEAAFQSLLLNCRFAKEKLFSAADSKKDKLSARILFADFRPLRLSYTTLVEDICNRPVAPVLVKYCALPEADAVKLGDLGWRAAFAEFVAAQVESMARPENGGITLSKLFLTGSASRMFFVRETCKQILPQLNDEGTLIDDTNPSNAISAGLAMVGASERKAEAFQRDMDVFFDNESGTLYRMIEHRVPDLTQCLIDPIMEVIQNDIVIPEIQRWKRGTYATVNDLISAVRNICEDKEEFNRLLSQNKNFQSAVRLWMSDQLGNDVAIELQRIAVKNQVTDFSTDDLNAFKVEVGLDGSVINSARIDIEKWTPMEAIMNVLAAVVGVIAFIIAPYIIAVIAVLADMIIDGILIAILTAISTVPGALAVEAVMAVMALLAGKGVVDAYRANKEKISRKLLDVNLPGMIRNGVKTEDFAKQFQQSREQFSKELMDSMKKTTTIAEMARSIYGHAKPQIEKRADQIRYEIEAR